MAWSSYPLHGFMLVRRLAFSVRDLWNLFSSEAHAKLTRILHCFWTTLQGSCEDIGWLQRTRASLRSVDGIGRFKEILHEIRLRNRLVKIMTGYQTETSLRNGCIDILKADCVNLLVKYYHEARRGGTHGKHMDEETVCKNQVEQSLLITGFGYEHDDARMTNINLFKEFTALSRICTSEFSIILLGCPFLE
ncbi:Vacuolar protein sorting-associated protein 41 [Zea mays]|uniref:Vacuolar protein sorting-associated protein 41 n=1 Tax=Zea mays TaxID=4577 RepID=A0A317Y2W1_MAIZE|nr:Vacuolar protein sorting-associated protein 41 [Zea mays]